MNTVHECDRRTDRWTDRITITKTVQRRASHDRATQSVARPCNAERRTVKTDGILLRNSQIHGEFTVTPSSENVFVTIMVVSVMVIVCVDVIVNSQETFDAHIHVCICH